MMRLAKVGVTVSIIALSTPVFANLFTGTFEAYEGYTLGDVNGQNGWSYPGNTFTRGDVVAAPAGTPSFLGQQSLLATTTIPANDGVTDGVLTPSVGPYGPAGSQKWSGPAAAPVGNQAQADYWFRTYATSAASSSIPDGTFFFQTNLKSGDDRFGRVQLFQRTGTTYQIITDSYKTIDTNNAPPDNSNVPDQTIATGLNFGQWYHLQASVSLVGHGQSGDLLINNDVLRIQIFDEFGNLQGSVNDGSTWRLAWYFPSYDGFPGPGNIEYSIDGLNFLARTGGAVPGNTPLMYIDAPEPSSLGLIGLAGLAMFRRRRA